MKANAVKVDNVKVTDPKKEFSINKKYLLQVGKRIFRKIIFKKK
jgi:hypothetical protein